MSEHKTGGATDAVSTAYRRLADVDDPAIFLQLAPADRATAGAGPLAGQPFAVKDNIDVALMPTTAGCAAFARQAQEDAHVVARLRAAGAVPLGKTNLDQFATGLVGTRTPFGVPRNARDPALVPGGSSSGSAVAVAHGIVPFALGTDTAGSGRVPAALNGIVGIKPSLGLLSSRGVVPACRTLDTVSVFARAVADGYAALTAAAGYDAAEPFSRRLPVRPPFAPDLVRLAVPDGVSAVFDTDADRAAFAATLARLPDLGIEPVPIDFAPFFAVAALLYDGPWVAERHTVVEDLMRTAPDALHPITRAVIGKALDQSATDAFRGRYALADLTRQIETRLDGLDGLLTPSIPGVPTLEAVAADPFGANSRLGTYTNFVNLLDLCAVTVPTGPLRAGLPASVTVVARAGADHLAAALGDRIHRAFDPALAPLPSAAEPVAGEVTFAVVGAHMRGLPLNGELTACAARFLFEATTAPAYRLYALAGGPPHRPGLVRVASGGAAIALEVWAMPAAELGSFVAAIPAPLGIGTLTLSDGRTVQGFLCEPARLGGARDITSYGGWRAFLAG